MLMGLFARADHPMGYGSATKGETMGKAHGWVVIVVQCSDEDQLKDVRTRLAIDPFTGIGDKPRQYNEGWLGEWYGGRFDFIGTIDGDFELDCYGQPVRFRSFGDNRFAGIYLAEEVLDEG